MCSLAARRRSQARWSLTALALASLLSVATGCGAHFVNRGTALYRDGHYVEAAEVFERTEERLEACSSRERARFGLYRGATFLKLGDVQHAARWLGYARAVKSSDPSALDSADSRLLDSSLAALGRVGPTEPTRHDESEVATAPSAERNASPQ